MIGLRFLVLASALLVTACSGVTRNALPADLHTDARVLGRNDLRAWGDVTSLEADTMIVELADQEAFIARASGISDRPHNYLAISGGGANGAYGAGLLVGWSDMGTRPKFTVVTGISTGALSAPFAFLGPDYDDQLREVYTSLGTDYVIKARSPFKILGGDSVADSSPLAATIERYITDDMIDAIAAQYRTGRQLLLGTTNLDAGRPVIWNIGRIADSGLPGAPALIRSVMLASASIPGALPPVYIPVQGRDGKIYDEMHVDGGASTQVFLYPSGVDWDEALDLLNVQGKPTAYVIRNSRLRPDYEPVDPKLIPIAARSIDSMIRTQGIGDAFRILALAKRDGLELELTWIPKDAVEDTSDEPFDIDYMQDLFDYGYQRIQAGEAWIDEDYVLENRGD
ncbi:MAG: patatin-like phospholipase family protein [Pseudomonadota bacterium]